MDDLLLDDDISMNEFNDGDVPLTPTIQMTANLNRDGDFIVDAQSSDFTPTTNVITSQPTLSLMSIINEIYEKVYVERNGKYSKKSDFQLIDILDSLKKLETNYPSTYEALIMYGRGSDENIYRFNVVHGRNLTPETLIRANLILKVLRGTLQPIIQKPSATEFIQKIEADIPINNHLENLLRAYNLVRDNSKNETYTDHEMNYLLTSNTFKILPNNKKIQIETLNARDLKKNNFPMVERALQTIEIKSRLLLELSMANRTGSLMNFAQLY